MNELIEEQLKKTKAVSFYNKENKQVSINEIRDETVLLIREKNYSDPKEDLVLFTFKDYLIKPFENFDFHEKFNKGKIIPLKIMQGRIIRTVGKMYYIKVRGYYIKTDYCLHCLKKNIIGPTCSDCFKVLNVNDVEEIEWEGFVLISSIEEIVRL